MVFQTQILSIESGHRVRDEGRAGGAGPRPGRHAHPVPPHLREDPRDCAQGYDLQVRKEDTMITGYSDYVSLSDFLDTHDHIIQQVTLFNQLCTG